MKTIAVTLIHDRGGEVNERQINELLDKLEPQYIEAVMDGEGSEPVQLFSHYRFKGVDADHEVKVYQLVPRGVTPPANYHDLISYNVEFGNDVPDKDTQWYNVALARAGQHGADVMAYVDKVEDVIPADLIANQDVVKKEGQTKIADTKAAPQLDTKNDLATSFDSAVVGATIDG